MLRKATIYLVFFIAVANTLSAQCAMCRSTAASNMDTGGSIGAGLNSGILYMLAVVYLVLCSMLYFFFRQQINERLNRLKNRFFPQKR